MVDLKLVNMKTDTLTDGLYIETLQRPETGRR